MELYFLRRIYLQKCKTPFSISYSLFSFLSTDSEKQIIHTYIHLWQFSNPMTIIQALSFIKIPKLDLSLDSQKITYARHNSSQGLNSVQEASQPSLMSMWDVRKGEGRGEYPWCARSSLKRNGTKRVGERKAETMDCIWRKKGRERRRKERMGRGTEGKRCCSLPAGARGNYKIAKINHKTWPAWCALP